MEHLSQGSVHLDGRINGVDSSVQLRGVSPETLPLTGAQRLERKSLGAFAQRQIGRKYYRYEIRTSAPKKSTSKAIFSLRRRR
jgi:hypothetical protein